MTYKVLCICGWGQVRSVAMAQYIHELNGKNEFDELKYEAIPIGWKVSSEQTIALMKDWADLIIDVRKYLPEDLWHNPRHPELKEKVKEIWKEVWKETQ